MPTIEELRDRSRRLYTELLTPTSRAAESTETAPTERVYSWFDPDDAAETLALAFQMALRIATAPEETDGMADALDLAEQQAGELPSELVAHALGLLTTHNRPARRLAVPRALRVAPQLFVAAPSPDDDGVRTGSTGDEAVLDYWREDPFANEHHMHWHLVYPWAGVLPADMLTWATEADPALFAELLTAFDPDSGDWRDFVATATPQQRLEKYQELSGLWTPRERGQIARRQSVQVYRLLYHLKDRQGELFLYMHSQMLARYDAERRANDREPVGTYGPTDFANEIPEGYDPMMDGFVARPPNQVMAAGPAQNMQTWQSALEQAVDDGKLTGRGTPAAVVPIDRTNIGEATEASQFQLIDSDNAIYGSLHNTGHGALAALPPPPTPTSPVGVMSSTRAAIRDPIFWRWHRNIDGINVRWQETQPLYDFSAYAPPVELRSGAGATFWHSQDLLLVPTDQLPAGADGAALAAAALGGDDAWETLFEEAGPVGPDGLVLTNMLTTRFVRSDFGAGTVTHLTHDPFALVVRLRNTCDAPIQVTLRVFLALAELSEQREHWIELDKWPIEVPAGAKHVAYRPDTEFSVVKKPAETDPQTVLDGLNAADDYCDCGWPYTLLLPRGTEQGSSYRLLVACTDTAQDDVRTVGGCGSLSFCGAVDRYPDRLDMGFPFSRRIEGSIGNNLPGRSTMAGRGVGIRHVP